MAQAGAYDEGDEHSRSVPSPYVSLVDRQAGAHGGKPPKAEVATTASSPRGNGAGAQQTGQGGNDKLLMKRTLVAQSKKIQQLTAKIDGMESEREAMAQQVAALRMAVFEASTRAEQTAEQYKRDAVEAAVREIAQDREAFAEGRREAVKRIGELEDALEIALKAAGGVHRKLLELGLSCEDLGKTSVHLSVAAQEAPAEDKPALAVAGETIEAVVGVMRAMERSGVFDILDPVDDEEEGETEEEGDEEGPPPPLVLPDKPPASGDGAPFVEVLVGAVPSVAVDGGAADGAIGDLVVGANNQHVNTTTQPAAAAAQPLAGDAASPVSAAIAARSHGPEGTAGSVGPPEHLVNISRDAAEIGQREGQPPARGATAELPLQQALRVDGSSTARMETPQEGLLQAPRDQEPAELPGPVDVERTPESGRNTGVVDSGQPPGDIATGDANNRTSGLVGGSSALE
ncbi:unnamed protein product [Ectocarpus sp. 12 AP-2014]